MTKLKLKEKIIGNVIIVEDTDSGEFIGVYACNCPTGAILRDIAEYYSASSVLSLPFTWEDIEKELNKGKAYYYQNWELWIAYPEIKTYEF